LRSAGIWDDVRLLITGGAYLRDVWVPSEIQGNAAAPESARVSVRLTIDSDRPRPTLLRLAILTADGDTALRSDYPLSLASGEQTPIVNSRLQRPLLRQPR